MTFARFLCPLLFILTLSAGLLMGTQSHAQNIGGSKAPVEITADEELEWDRDNRRYIARGTAKAVQAENMIEADTLYAHYTDQQNGGGVTITHMEAQGRVILTSDVNIAYGDFATYDLETGEAVLTGETLILTTPEDTLTARDKITYNAETDIMRAIGKAKLEHGDDTLESDILIAYFTEINGRKELAKMEAVGSVVITTPTEILTGDKALYDASSNTAKIFDNVTIRRGQNILTGDRGEVDLDTRLSRLSSDAENGQRVKGVFYPE